MKMQKTQVWNARALSLTLMFLSILLFASPAASQSELLQIDGFVSGQPATFQAGFVTGEIGAVRLVPTIPCPCLVDSIELIYGGGAGTYDVGLFVWDDLGTLDPGTERFNGTTSLAGSNDSIHVVGLSGSMVEINGPIRVGVEIITVPPGGTPSIATDFDGISASDNFLFVDLGVGFAWLNSSTLGVSGDWIIRANISTIPPAVPMFEPVGLVVLLIALLGIGAATLSRRGASKRA